MRKRFLFVLTILIMVTSQPAFAQGSGPVYIVQPGDTLSSIAARFNVTLNDLMTANNITNPNILSAGQQLTIPGLEGVTGILDTQVVGFGDSLRSLLRRTQMPLSLLQKLNHLVSPTELYVGASLIIPKQDNGELSVHAAPRKGESLLELAVRQGSDPWTMEAINGLAGSWDALPGDSLYSSTGTSDPSMGGLPSALISADVKTLPLKQGGTAEIIVKPVDGTTLGGILGDYPLHFFPLGDGSQVALQGIHALLEPGAYPLRIDATLPDGTTQSYEQMVLVVSGNYAEESLSVSTEFVDPTVTKPEDEQVAKITAPITPQKYWQGPFILPIYVPADQQPCIYDWFGIRRSFNGSAFDYFHSGIDFGVCFAEHPFDIYAAAPGKVVFAGPLTVRGNATFIDHGWGIYSAYFHQKEIDVSVGQQVQAGELIGQIGATGRVTGPHLHWEIWVGGVQVNPMDWLNAQIP